MTLKLELEGYIRLRRDEVKQRKDCLFQQSNGVWGAINGRNAKNKIRAAKKVLHQLEFNVDSIREGAELNTQDVDMLNDGRLGIIIDRHSLDHDFPINVIVAREETAQRQSYMHMAMKL